MIITNELMGKVREEIILLVKSEYENATRMYGPFASSHEGLAVIREEYLELEKEVFTKQSEYDYEKMELEARQLSAMAIRFIIDVCRILPKKD